MTVRIELSYDGELHTSAEHPSGAKLGTDAPLDNQGRGEAFSPTDLVAAALGSCMMTVMGIVARRHDWSLEGSKVTVDKEMVANPVRRLGRLGVAFEMAPGIPKDARKILERTAHTCPVCKSLCSEVEVDVHFDWSRG